MTRILITIVFMALINTSVYAQKYTISGYVTEASSGEPIIGAAVLRQGSTMGTVTSNSGYYSMSFEKGDMTLEVSSLGYDTRQIDINLSANIKLDITLEHGSDLISEAVVTAHYSNLGARGSQMSAVEIPLNQIKAIPTIGGEVDVIKAVQLLPGVQSGTEGTASMYVRGGGADENLLLMDGVPLYNVNHLFGFFSVFNADALKNVTLYKGSFPARFGGHLSSVLDVRMNDGNESEFHGSGTIGLISSKFNLEGPIVKGRTTFNVSARRTYLDLLAKPVIAFMNSRGKKSGNYKSYSGGYDFYDLNAKVTHRFDNRDRLSLSFYSGDDKAGLTTVDYSREFDKDYDEERYMLLDTGTEQTCRLSSDFGWKWGNMVGALRWTHEIGPKLFMETSASYTQYRSSLGVGSGSYLLRKTGEHVDKETSQTSRINFNSIINDVSATADFEYYPNLRHDIRFGLGYTYHNFRPGVISVNQNDMTNDNDEPKDFNRQVGDAPVYSNESAIYLEDNWTVTSWLKADMGLRGSTYMVRGKSYFSLEPRLSARVLLTEILSVKASYSEMSQYIHLLCNSNISLPSDLWVPVTDRIHPMKSRQMAVGSFYDTGKFEFSVEGYYKTMDNVLEYKDGASYLGTSTGWEDKVNMGKGWSYGLEILAQRKVGMTTGWIGYTLSKSMRQFDRPGNVINDGNPFPAKYDRRHDISATVTHTFSKRFDISGTFVYSSGNCGTLAMEYFTQESLVDEGNGAGFSPDKTSIGLYIPNRNNYRMPAYHRMDIGMNFYKEKKRGTRIWNVSVYNVYNRLNPFMITTGTKPAVDENGNHVNRPVLNKMSIFPIMPSASYTFKF